MSLLLTRLRHKAESFPGSIACLSWPCPADLTSYHFSLAHSTPRHGPFCCSPPNLSHLRAFCLLLTFPRKLPPLPPPSPCTRLLLRSPDTTHSPLCYPQNCLRGSCPGALYVCLLTACLPPGWAPYVLRTTFVEALDTWPGRGTTPSALYNTCCLRMRVSRSHPETSVPRAPQRAASSSILNHVFGPVLKMSILTT